jgi:hypothetical protein
VQNCSRRQKSLLKVHLSVCITMQTINKVYMVAEKVHKKFTSEATKQPKKVYFDAKKVYIF